MLMPIFGLSSIVTHAEICKEKITAHQKTKITTSMRRPTTHLDTCCMYCLFVADTILKACAVVYGFWFTGVLDGQIHGTAIGDRIVRHVRGALVFNAVILLAIVLNALLSGLFWGVCSKSCMKATRSGPRLSCERYGSSKRVYACSVVLRSTVVNFGVLLAFLQMVAWGGIAFAHTLVGDLVDTHTGTVPAWLTEAHEVTRIQLALTSTIGILTWLETFLGHFWASWRSVCLHEE